MECKSHGLTDHTVEKQGGVRADRHRCLKCGYERVAALRLRRKQELVAMLGGKCQKCNYDRSIAALDFHHRDPAQKLFEISQGLQRFSTERLVEEAKKCDLLCRNCHAETEYPHTIAA